jgi:hypothetical protein
VSGADAAGADLDAPDGTVPHGLDLLQVRAPDFAGFVVGVADVIPEARAFTAYFAYSGHSFYPPVVTEVVIYSRTNPQMQEKCRHPLQF